jgi:hypothetical protein
MRAFAVTGFGPFVVHIPLVQLWVPLASHR